MTNVLLPEVCAIEMGQAPKGSSYNEDGLGLPMIAGASDLGDHTPSPSRFTDSPTKVCRPGDLILCIRATIGDLNVADREYCLGRGVAGLRAKTDRLNDRYLWHWITASADNLRSMGRGATFLQISKKDLQALQIPLRPLPEQRRIAAILDAAEALRTKRRESLVQLDQLVKSLFLEMFGDPVTNPKGWEVASLGDLISGGPSNGLYKPARDYGSGIPILRISDFQAGQVVARPDLRRVRLTDAEVVKYRLAPGDLVINRVNSRSHLGKAALIQELQEPTVYESNMMRIQLDTSRVNPEYALRALSSRHVRNQILRAAKDAVNQSSINQTDVKGLRIPVPRRADQCAFVSAVGRIEDQRARLNSHLAEFDTLSASLHSRAFRGEL